MNIDEAIKIISDNYECNENCFFYLLREEESFCAEKFWEYYDSITAFVGVTEKDPEITRQITHSYQRILKEFIFHFDPADYAVIADCPNNYVDYIDRLDHALLAYYTDNMDLLDDENFELQR